MSGAASVVGIKHSQSPPVARVTNWDLWRCNLLERAITVRLAYVRSGSRGRALASHGPEQGPHPALRHRLPDAGWPPSERPLPRSGEGCVRCDMSELRHDHAL